MSGHSRGMGETQLGPHDKDGMVCLPPASPVLSICIPTYNRARTLRNTLEVLMAEAAPLGVSIHVSDNASPDDTPAVVESFMRRYPYLHYTRHEENTGERNFPFVLRQSGTRYAWLLADYTVPTPGTLSRLIGELQEHSPDVAVLNSPGRVKGIPSRVYDNPDEMLSEIGWHMTWVSALVYGRRLIDEADFDRYLGTCFIQAGAIFEYLARQGGHCLFDSRSCFRILDPCKKNSWSSITFQVFIDFWCAFVRSLPDAYSEQSRKRCVLWHGTRSGLFTLKGFLVLRENGALTPAIYRKYRDRLPEVTEVKPGVVGFIAHLPRIVLTPLKWGVLGVRTVLARLGK